jgi:hypothetical protein
VHRGHQIVTSRTADGEGPLPLHLFHGQATDIVDVYLTGVFLAKLDPVLAARQFRRGAITPSTVLSTGDVDKAKTACAAVTCVTYVMFLTKMNRK